MRRKKEVRRPVIDGLFAWRLEPLTPSLLTNGGRDRAQPGDGALNPHNSTGTGGIVTELDLYEVDRIHRPARTHCPRMVCSPNVIVKLGLPNEWHKGGRHSLVVGTRRSAYALWD